MPRRLRAALAWPHSPRRWPSTWSSWEARVFQLSEWSLAVTCVRGVGAGLFSASRAAGRQAQPRERRGGRPAPPLTGTTHPSLLGGIEKPAPYHLHLPLHHLEPVQMDRAKGLRGLRTQGSAAATHLSVSSRLSDMWPREHVSFLARRGLGCGQRGAQRGGSILVLPGSTIRPSSTASRPTCFFVFPFEETRNWGPWCPGAAPWWAGGRLRAGQGGRCKGHGSPERSGRSSTSP